MKHILPFLIFCLYAECLFAQSTIQNSVREFGTDTIQWKENSLLKFSDFKSKPSGSFQGNTYAGITLDFKQDANGSRIFLYTIFFCRLSFLKDTSANLLNHEQLHFDITELYARKLRQQISQKNFQNEKNIAEVVQKIYYSLTADLNKAQDNYDKETVHGTNSVKQQKWYSSIHEQLKILEKFSEVEVNID